ncbi:response regulator [Colwellia psychrerythraea]|uniref:Response regulator receiver protein n=1 Tax=Colwellia psychrerythraea TaxID=28229 RepID=A0A099KBZ6_COLPS|nr:response regulator [Colwellia psychrerythraea]KGJ87552.1 response regulator receiver protein [Colwellia psychrerythraea]
MPLKNSVKSYLTPKEVAELLMVSTAAVRLWAEQGNLKARVTAGGHRRFKLDDIKEFATKKNIQLNITASENPKVLIVDDDIHFAEFLKALLKIEINNIEVEISLDGFDAANKLHDFTPDILLLDLKMPGLDGFQVCQVVKENPIQNHIRVITISGSTSQSDIDKLKGIGAEACLNKPIDVAALLKQLALN